MASVTYERISLPWLGRTAALVGQRLYGRAPSQLFLYPQTDPQNAMSYPTCVYLDNLHVLVSRCKTNRGAFKRGSHRFDPVAPTIILELRCIQIHFPRLLPLLFAERGGVLPVRGSLVEEGIRQRHNFQRLLQLFQAGGSRNVDPHGLAGNQIKIVV